jgi:hypothetical protein
MQEGIAALDHQLSVECYPPYNPLTATTEHDSQNRNYCKESNGP